MGSWGVGIFSNDDAADIREDLRDLIADGLTPEDATRRLQEDYGVGGRGPDDNDFWLGLAAAQHSIGHVVPEVLDHATAIIDDPEELARWTPKDRKRRRAVLLKLRERLAQPPPPPKQPRPRTKADTRLEVGQHVLVRVDDRRVLFRVTGVTEDKGGRYPGVVVVDWDGSDRQLRRAHRLPPALDPKPLRDDEAMGFVLIGEPTDPDDLLVLDQRADRRTPARRWSSGTVTKWSELDRFLPRDPVTL
ncbi:MAG: hypothetical protein U0R78_14245 [Nocardioidaceae bacterium]